MIIKKRINNKVSYLEYLEFRKRLYNIIIVSINVILLISAMFIMVMAVIYSMKMSITQLNDFCAEKNWTGTYNITGELSGYINCTAALHNKQPCSNSLFSPLPLCDGGRRL